MSRARMGLATAAYSVQTLGVQIAALLSLNPAAFGWFSVLYLGAALVLSVQLSLISDAWVRHGGEDADSPEVYRSYSAATVLVSIIGATVVAAIAFFIDEAQDAWWLVALAVLFSTLRASLRYYSLRQREWRYVVPGDMAGAITALIGGAFALIFFSGDLRVVMGVWGCSFAVSVVLSKRPKFSLVAARDWFTRNRRDISPLLKDSLLQDFGAIGTPYILLPILGISGFGVYRAVSNVAAPVRLVLSTLRPAIATSSMTRRYANALLVRALAMAFVAGLGAGLVLVVLDLSGASVGTLSALGPYAIGVGCYVGATLVGSLYLVLGRTMLRASSLVLARLAHTAIALVGPLAGALFDGLSGAIWGLAVATLAWCAVWVALVLSHIRKLSA